MGTGNRAVWNKGGERGGTPWSRGKLEKPGGGNMGTQVWRGWELVGVGEGRLTRDRMVGNKGKRECRKG